MGDNGRSCGLVWNKQNWEGAASVPSLSGGKPL